MTFANKHSTSYKVLSEYYEGCLKKHGPTAQGVDWPTEEGATLRHRVMAELWAPETSPGSILDVGCGYGAFLDCLSENQSSASYTGIDLSPRMIETACHRHSHRTSHFMVRDIIENPLPPASFDYGVMNGVLTEKRELEFEDMCSFAQAMILSLFTSCRKGIAFNMMSPHVDYERSDLFHMPFDRLAAFLTKVCSRHFIIRSDYGLYDYTIYIYRTPRLGA